MRNRKLQTTLLVLLAGLAGWSCAAVDRGSGIEPGLGVTIGGQALHLGDALGQLKERFGPPDRVLDLSPQGIRFRYDALAVSGWLNGPGDSATVTSIQVDDVMLKCPKGLGAGSPEADIQAVLGAPVVDPFLGTWLYRERGLGFGMMPGPDGTGRIARYVLLFPPAP